MILGNEWNSENCYSEADNHTKVIEILNNHTKVIKILRKKHNQGRWMSRLNLLLQLDIWSHVCIFYHKLGRHRVSQKQPEQESCRGILGVSWPCHLVVVVVVENITMNIEQFDQYVGQDQKLCCWFCFCWLPTFFVNRSLLFLLLLSLTSILSCKHIVVVVAVNHLLLAAPKCLESLRESAIWVAFRWLFMAHISHYYEVWYYLAQLES